jgi:hypothetical protein
MASSAGEVEVRLGLLVSTSMAFGKLPATIARDESAGSPLISFSIVPPEIALTGILIPPVSSKSPACTVYLNLTLSGAI